MTMVLLVVVDPIKLKPTSTNFVTGISSNSSNNSDNSRHYHD
jgi:hypothetical protein